jgi:hypothetical protein
MWAVTTFGKTESFCLIPFFVPTLDGEFHSQIHHQDDENISMFIGPRGGLLVHHRRWSKACSRSG